MGRSWRMAVGLLGVVLLALHLSAAPAEGVSLRMLLRAQPVPQIGTKEWTELWRPKAWLQYVADHYDSQGKPLPNVVESAPTALASDSAKSAADKQMVIPDSILPDQKYLLAPQNVLKNPYLLIRGSAIAPGPGDKEKGIPNAKELHQIRVFAGGAQADDQVSGKKPGQAPGHDVAGLGGLVTAARGAADLALKLGNW